MSVFLIGILILFGIVLIVLEILIVPGMVVGFLGLIFILLGIAGTWNEYGSTAGIVVGLISALITFLAIWSALRTGFWKHFSLKDRIESKVNEIDKSLVKPGDLGHAVSSLRPMGTVRINGERFEASCETGMIPPNYPVEVLHVESNKLIVKARD